MKQCFVFLKTLSPVQPPHPQIQIPRERHPHQIRQHQPCGRLRDAVKGNGSGENQDPQSDQPQKGEKIPSQVEEPDGPEKIKNKFLLKDTMKITSELVSAQFNSQNIEIIENIEDIEINSYENKLIKELINILNNAKDALKSKEQKLDKKLIFIDI